MPGFSSQGCTFTFNGQQWDVTSVSVEAPQPEVVDMTSATAPVRTKRMVPTGDWLSPGKIIVDALGRTDPKDLVGARGQCVFSTAAPNQVTVSRTAICDSASVEATVGSLFRVRFTLMPTDYTN